MDSQLTAKHKVVHADSLDVVVPPGSMTRLTGVSKALAGTEGIHMAIATIPPACAAGPHYHVNCESAIYVVKGRGRFLSGENLQNADEIGPGDFIYVPPNSVHQSINNSLTEPMELIAARNTPVEIVVEYDPESAQASAD